MGEQHLHRTRPVAWMVGILAVATVVLAACSTPSAPGAAARQASTTPAAPANSGPQVREGGQVTVAVSWAGASAGPVFGVAIDTHSVDLDAIDLVQQAALRTPAGELRPTRWAAAKGGHHRSGELTFPAMLPDGRPTIGTGPVELVIRDIGGVPERSFAWQP